MNEELGTAAIELILQDQGFRARLLRSVGHFQDACRRIQTAASGMATSVGRTLARLDIPSAVFNRLRIYSQMLGNAARGASRMIGAGARVAGQAAGAAGNLGGPVGRIAGGVMNGIGRAIGAISNMAGEIAAAVSNALSTIIGTTFSIIETAFATVYNIATGVIKSIASGVFSIFSSIAGSIMRMFEVAGGIMLANMISAAVDAMRGLVDQGVAANAQFERMEVGLTNMLGSANAARKYMDDIRKLAAETPLETMDLTGAFTSLLSTKQIAEKELIPTLRKLGDVAAASSDGFSSFPRITRAITQMLSKGKLQGEEMLQLAEAGVPAWTILAERMGKSTAEVQKMASTGKLGTKEVLLLIDALGGRFKGMAKAQSKTFEGLQSTISDNITLALARVTRPIFEMKKKMAEAFVVFLDSDQLENATKFLTEMVRTFVDFVQQTGNEFRKFFSGFQSGLADIAPTLYAIYGDFVEIGTNIREMINPALSSMLGIMASGENFAGGMVDQLKKLTNVILVLTSDWNLMWQFVSAKASEIVTEIQERFQYLFGSVIPALWQGAIGTMGTLFEGLGPLITDHLKAAFTDAIRFFMSLIGKAMSFFAGLIGSVVSAMVAGFDTVIAGAKIALAAATGDEAGTISGQKDLLNAMARSQKAAGVIGGASDAIGGIIGGAGAVDTQTQRESANLRFREFMRQQGGLGGITGSNFGAFNGLPGFAPSQDLQARRGASGAAFGALQQESEADDNRRTNASAWGVSNILSGISATLGAGIDLFQTMPGRSAAMASAPVGKGKVEFAGTADLAKKYQSAIGGDKDDKLLKVAEEQKVKATEANGFLKTLVEKFDAIKLGFGA